MHTQARSIPVFDQPINEDGTTRSDDRAATIVNDSVVVLTAEVNWNDGGCYFCELGAKSSDKPEQPQPVSIACSKVTIVTSEHTFGLVRFCFASLMLAAVALCCWLAPISQKDASVELYRLVIRQLP
jgi:hypothetical protein